MSITSSIVWTLAKILAYLVFVINAAFAFVLVYIAKSDDPLINMKLIELAITSLGSGSMWAAILMGAKAGAQAYQGGNPSGKPERERG